MVVSVLACDQTYTGMSKLNPFFPVDSALCHSMCSTWCIFIFLFLGQLLPLVTEVFLKLLLVTDHPATLADVILHHVSNDGVAKEFITR